MEAPLQGTRTIASLLFFAYANLTTGIASAITVADGIAQPAGSVPFSLEGVVHVGSCSSSPESTRSSSARAPRTT
jgi:hypothetical protein